MTNARISVKRAKALWRWVMSLTAIMVGFGYAFGPDKWYQTPSLELVRQFWIPVPIWGALMMVAGALILTRARPYGHFIAMCLWTFWFACISVSQLFSFAEWIASLFDISYNSDLPDITGWGVPAYVLVYAMVHMHMLLAPRGTIYLVPCYSKEDSD